MKVVILAAGMGKRLSQKIPKALVKIFKNKTILDFQLERILKKIPAENIIIVVGYKKNEIISNYNKFIFVENQQYEITNTSKSLLEGLKDLDDDVIWMNGDIYFEEGILDLLLKNDLSCCLVTNKKCGEEEVKFNLNEGEICEISKKVKEPMGEALGINKILKNDLRFIKEELAKVENEDYFEKAVENIIKNNKVKFYPVDIKNLFCVEIDYESDLQLVKDHIKSKK